MTTVRRLQGAVPRRAPGKMSYSFNSPELSRRLALLASSPPKARPNPNYSSARSPQLGGVYRTRQYVRYGTSWVRWLAAALVAIGIVVAGVGVSQFLSNRAQHTGFLEDHPFIILPDLNKPSCGKACAYMTVLNGETSAFNFTLLNRVVAQYNYSLNFDLQTQNVNITRFVGEFFLIAQDGAHTKTPLTITWNAQNETSVQGFVSGLHVLEQETVWYSLELTMTWDYQGGFLDGAYLLTYWASPT